MANFVQKIFFGSPGTGKSYKVEHSVLPQLNIQPNSGNCIKTVFHPEYTYGDFIGKLLPISREERKIEYRYYEGHFLRALGCAFKNILTNPQNPDHVALVIDEINRGNSSAIFGTIFQLLDRNEDGWSDYSINLSEMEFEKFLEIVGIQTTYTGRERVIDGYKFKNKSYKLSEMDSLLKIPISIRNYSIKIPPNLSIIGTMNTSDNSIYYMDSAFKRRWEWEFVSVDAPEIAAIVKDRMIEGKSKNYSWKGFVDQLNKFIKSNNQFVRGIEDKQVGYFFIRGNTVSMPQIKNKLLFFLWDSVFSRDKKPLNDLINKKLVTFGDFADNSDEFIEKIMAWKQP